MRKVLMMGPVPPPFGGIASVMQTIVNSPLAKDYQFEVFDRGHEIPPEYSGLFAKNWFRINRLIKFFFKLRRQRFDFVHMHVPFGDSFPGTTVFMFLSKLAGVKILLHIHGTDWDTFYTQESRKMKVIYKIGLRMPEQIIVLYDVWRTNIKKLVPAANISALPNCLEDEESPDPMLVEKIRSEMAFGPENIIVLTVGFVGWRKGHLDILDAVPRVVNKNDNVRFVMVGGEEYPGESYLVKSRIDSENLGKWVLMTHEIERTEIPAYLACSDVFLLPSNREGMPISILEAMRAGLPVIVTKVGAIPEMVENDESGILIGPGDSDAIARAVIRLSQDSELRIRLARRARKEFESRFEVNACIEKLASIYNAMSAMD
jgi:glycosyltransferase involved in cell wall biosynthesis